MQGAVAIVVKRNIRRVGVPATKRGRPRKTNVRRDASGKSRGEIEDLSIIFNQPHRRGSTDPSSPLLGTALGRLRVIGEISDDQLRAGDEWGKVVSAYRKALCAPSGSPISGSMSERVSNGFYSWEAEVVELDPDEIRKRRLALASRYNDCLDNLATLDRSFGFSGAIGKAVRKVCVDDRDPAFAEIGNLRLGLNSLSKILFRKD